MYRAAPRLIARAALPRTVAPAARRFISTAPPTQKSRSWKSLVARFGIAGTIIYYYNTTDVFAEEPLQPIQALPETDNETEQLPTIESIAAERAQRKAVQAQLDAQKEAQAKQQQQQQDAPQLSGEGEGEGGMQGLEGEADQQGAFNPETGEINWDCPCLGGMAHGPCGEQFKAAFSCFVYSEEEPKGMDCIDKFKDMQNCFREHPDVYGSELEGADDEEEQDEQSAPAATHSEATPAAAYSDSTSAPASQKPSSKTAPKQESAAAEKGKQSAERGSKPGETATPSSKLGLVPDNYKPEPVSESEELVPKAAHDARK